MVRDGWLALNFIWASFNAFCPLGNSVSGDFLHLPTHDLNFVEHFIPNRHDTLGRRRRCRRAQIRRQIAKRHIGFMADSGNNRLFAHRNRADDALFIERPQILHRAAAARHNDDAHMFQPLKQMNGFNHLFIRPDSCTRTGQSRICASGFRRSDTFKIS